MTLLSHLSQKQVVFLLHFENLKQKADCMVILSNICQKVDGSARRVEDNLATCPLLMKRKHSDEYVHMLSDERVFTVFKSDS